VRTDLRPHRGLKVLRKERAKKERAAIEARIAAQKEETAKLKAEEKAAEKLRD
jgi:hypothetical protein